MRAIKQMWENNLCPKINHEQKQPENIENIKKKNHKQINSSCVRKTKNHIHNIKMKKKMMYSYIKFQNFSHM